MLKQQAQQKGPEMKVGETWKGVVKWYHEGRGRGYITADNGYDIRVYKSGIPGSGVKILNEYQRVEFTVAEENGELVADNIIKLGS
jgi:CspA family cold shock protein